MCKQASFDYHFNPSIILEFSHCPCYPGYISLHWLPSPVRLCSGRLRAATISTRSCNLAFSMTPHAKDMLRYNFVPGTTQPVVCLGYISR